MLHNKYFLRVFLVVVILLLMTIIDGNLYAQIGPPDGGNVDDTPMAPIDGFIGVAVAVGSYIGYKKLKKK